MRIGIDTFSIRDLKLGPFEQLAWIHAHGFEGAQFGGLGTDVGRLKEIRAQADELELYSHTSVSSPNWRMGTGTYQDCLTALREQITSAAEAGWHELHTSLGSDRNRYRHETCTWSAQLEGAVRVLRELAPVLRDVGSRIDLEPHFDTTTFELVRIAETVGSDICGICLDTANVMLFGEHPIDAIRRAAPYTHLTHLKDAFLFFGEQGLRRQTMPPGGGAIDWETGLSILAEFEPDLPLSIEDHKWLFGAEIFEPWWHAEQQDLSREELARTVSLAAQGQREILTGVRPDPDEYETIPHIDEVEERLAAGRDHLRGVLAKLAGRVE
ncbi:MAG: sugar phosphate isomerase/epimerase [Lentisphaerae bacterium]|jgi:sugar phosphate isomerase/epimerase|nr:sugar phosphate isomerase/epimerase [Lentisphaerota bacterium]MBT5605795.1 sugar phosphate isomerase/epimerase [Lentisphaerota bacterium]MBT7055832.1 sugar phosphate isomerase/epimerase [Lentisphaerota bacterium]MBT7847483.1 sugar phosphate isomerase/epimerase [Lentisphaerota bacterium]